VFASHAGVRGARSRGRQVIVARVSIETLAVTVP
jgi:hypothetical protein